LKGDIMRNGKLWNALVVLSVVLGLPLAGVAQQPPPAQPPQAEQAPLTVVQKKMQKVITVKFNNTPIEDVLRTIAEQADLDIVKGPDIKGEVTATLTDVPLGEALNQILSAYNCGYVASENIIRIVPASQLTVETEKLVSKVYRIYYANVTEVEQALTKIISKRGQVTASKGSSNIIVIDTESNIRAIDSFLEEIDRITPQIMVEVRIYDVSNADSLDLGVEWNNLGRNSGRGTGYPAINEDTGRVTGGPASGFSRSEPFVGGAFGSTTNKATGASGTLNFGILNESIDLDMIFTASQFKEAAKLLANPRIIVLDNETASFEVTREIPYQQLQQGGAQSYGTTEFKPVGVNLKVTPHLAKDGLVRMRIIPEFSVHVSNVTLSLVGTSTVSMPQPVVDKRKADTVAMVKDGQTVVVGGLRKDEVTQEISKVPLLGDIPIIGWLFRFQGEKNVNSDLMVFITPKIVDQPVMTDHEAKAFKTTDIGSPERIEPIIKPNNTQDEEAEDEQ
jgi:type IV pilus assembly protein PilQ